MGSLRDIKSLNGSQGEWYKNSGPPFFVVLYLHPLDSNLTVPKKHQIPHLAMLL